MGLFYRKESQARIYSLEVNARTGGVGEREQMAAHFLNIIEQGLRQYNGMFSHEKIKPVIFGYNERLNLRTEKPKK